MSNQGRPQILGVILRKTKGFGGLGLCPLDAQSKNKEFSKNLAGVPLLGDNCPHRLRQSPQLEISHKKKNLKVKYDDVMPINSHVTSEEGKRKLQPKYPNPKKIEEKKIRKKNLSATFQIFSKCHFLNFLSHLGGCVRLPGHKQTPLSTYI